MSSELKLPVSAVKEEVYKYLLEQMPHLIQETDHWLSSLSNFTAVIKESFPKVSWAGFYLVTEGKLVLGPFQGKIACTEIQPGRGVCGKVMVTKETEIVENVHDFPGHIACDSGSNSEIVVPLLIDGKLLGVLDLDSYDFSTFNDTDRLYLEQLVAQLLSKTTIPNI